MSGTRQFNDVQQMYEVLDSQISTALNCKKLEEAVVTLTMASMLAGVASEKIRPCGQNNCRRVSKHEGTWKTPLRESRSQDGRTALREERV